VRVPCCLSGNCPDGSLFRQPVLIKGSQSHPLQQRVGGNRNRYLFLSSLLWNEPLRVRIYSKPGSPLYLILIGFCLLFILVLLF
jgi:hypothetical protein